MKCFLFLAVFALNAHASVLKDDKQFPIPGQIYKPGQDTGMGKYATKSLYHTEKVALTFDDGPDAVLTPKVLDILKKYNVKATFFLLTDNITKETLPVVKRIIAEGHNIGSHHHDHVSNDTRPEAEYRAGLKKSILVTAGLMESENSLHREIYYRFPYGAYGSGKLSYHHMNVMKEVSNDLFGDNCINFAFWDIDSADWVPDITPDDIAQGIVSNIYGGKAFDFEKTSSGYKKVPYNITKPIGGGVILVHDVHPKTVAAVPIFLQKFKEKGVQVVPLQEVEEYSYHGKECRLKI